MPVVGDYKRSERGREAPKSLLVIEASANIGAVSECSVSGVRVKLEELVVWR